MALQQDKKTRKMPFFRFKQLGNEFLITNDSGEYSFVAVEDFQKLLDGDVAPWHAQHDEWMAKGFLPCSYKFDRKAADKFLMANIHIKSGPLLHIVIPTLRCNLKCRYCHASARGISDTSYDMSMETAKKIVDTIFCAPDQSLMLEFQGGEPLLNWEVVSFIIDYAREKERLENKKLKILLVSNLTDVAPEKLDYLIDKKVLICSSLDGPKAVHDKNRGGYAKTVANLKRVYQLCEERLKEHRPAAIVTVTRNCLTHARAIADEYVKLGLEGIYVRSINPYGFAHDSLKDLYYSPDEYLKFYRELLDHVIELNGDGKRFYENSAVVFLLRILKGYSPNFMDLRSPCGAGTGQISYNYNGDVYTCDEGRMVSMMGDESFRIGNVHENTYEELVSCPVVKAMATASCMEGLPSCVNCVYKPYCGVCPVYNYVMEGDIFSKTFHNDRCKIDEGILDIIFEKLKDPKTLEIFNSWLD